MFSVMVHTSLSISVECDGAYLIIYKCSEHRFNSYLTSLTDQSNYLLISHTRLVWLIAVRNPADYHTVWSFSCVLLDLMCDQNIKLIINPEERPVVYIFPGSISYYNMHSREFLVSPTLISNLNVHKSVGLPHVKC